MSDRLLAGSRLHALDGTLAQPFANRRGRVSRRAGLVLELWDRDGHRGVGEAAPLPGHSPDSLDDCRAALTDIAERIGSCDGQGWPLAPWLSAVPAARFAWESAWCDLEARRQGRSVAELLGGGLESVALNAVVDGLDAAGRALDRGITTLKVKVGGSDASAELDRLAALRQAFGDRFALRLDANGAFSLAEAPARLAEYQPLRPELVEQPTAPPDLAHLGRCAVPWAADESLIAAAPAEVDRLLAAAGCAAWVIKPAALGLRPARELALRALQAGLGVVITHLLDGPIGLAAACELALSLPRRPWACGLDRHPGLAIWPAVELPHHRRSPSDVRRSERPGLGFDREGLPWT